MGWATPVRASEAKPLGLKAAPNPSLMLRPCCWPGINPVLGEAQPPNPRLRQKEEPIQRVCEIRSGSDPTWTLTARSFLQDQSIEMATLALSQSDHQTGPPGPEWERNVGQGLKPDAKRRHGAWGVAVCGPVARFPVWADAQNGELRGWLGGWRVVS